MHLRRVRLALLGEVSVELAERLLGCRTRITSLGSVGDAGISIQQESHARCARGVDLPRKELRVGREA